MEECPVEMPGMIKCLFSTLPKFNLQPRSGLAYDYRNKILEVL